MELSKVGDWMGEHPYATGAIVIVGGLALLYMFGFIGGGSAAPAQSTNLAGAYYAAEAAQSQAGAAIQISTLQTAAQTAQTKIQGDTAVALNDSNNRSAVRINQQNTGSANTIAGYELQGSLASTAADVTKAGYQLQATQSNNATIQANNWWNSYFSDQADIRHTNATAFSNIVNTVIPAEIAMNKGDVSATTQYGNLYLGTSGGPNIYRGAGYSEAEIAKIFG